MLRPTETDFVQPDLPHVPSINERHLRQRIGELVAQQAVEDEGERRVPAGQGLYHRYNAILKRCTGNKTRAELTAAELKVAISWLERNRLADHDAVLAGDARYVWTARQRQEWKPPVGRANGRPRGAPPTKRLPVQPGQRARRRAEEDGMLPTRVPTPSVARDGPS